MQRDAADRGSEQDTANLALVVAQNIGRTAGELDRIIKYLRQVYMHDGYSANWPALVKEEYTVDDEAAQIAIIDKNGMMITSSALLYPTKPRRSQRQGAFRRSRALA